MPKGFDHGRRNRMRTAAIRPWFTCLDESVQSPENRSLGIIADHRYAHLSPAYLSAEVGLLDQPAPASPPPIKVASAERAKKGQRMQTRDRAPAKVVEFPRKNGSSGWTRTSNPPVNRRK